MATRPAERHPYISVEMEYVWQRCFARISDISIRKKRVPVEREDSVLFPHRQKNQVVKRRVVGQFQTAEIVGYSLLDVSKDRRLWFEAVKSAVEPLEVALRVESSLLDETFQAEDIDNIRHQRKSLA